MQPFEVVILAVQLRNYHRIPVSVRFLVQIPALGAADGVNGSADRFGDDFYQGEKQGEGDVGKQTWLQCSLSGDHSAPLECLKRWAFFPSRKEWMA